MRVKEESEKVGLKLNIQKTKIMVSGPITSWQTERAKNGSSDRFYFQKSLQTVTAATKLKDAPWKESYVTNLDSILKSRDIT